jgi:Uma2 family endonuclease
VRPGQATIVDPVLLVEILSPSNQSKTWANIRAYTSVPSVQEILILRSDRVGAEVLRRDATGAWPDRTTPITNGMLDLRSIGFLAPLAELYARTGLAG